VVFNSWREKAKTDPSSAIVQRYHERPAEELYDLLADPLELINLAAEPEQAERLASLRAELDAWTEAQGDTGKIYGEPRLLTDPVRARRWSRGEEKQ
jgi:N-sulfoglucosamine sulfohydrolase